MSDTFNAREMTKGPVLALEKGINSVRIRHTFAATLSGVSQLNLCKVPPGAEVMAVAIKTQHAALADAADTYSVHDNEGNQYGATAVAATVDAGTNFMPKTVNANAANGRITGSAHLFLRMNTKAATGTAAAVVEVTALYKSSKDGD